jgi:2-oxoisovalerate ferredoxin oxidoreductase beta subunit
VSTFYEKFERHDHGQGIKGRATHYCAGCGHGLAHRYLSDAIEKLGVADRTVAISPVGCGVFLFWYLDAGNSQASHGRAAAVAVGHKLANPSSIVVSYQGDGDLASIGLLEIMNAAQLGVPITVVFINNAIYGMTGGQLAPTTLMGQKTTTSPRGRDRMMGQPMRMAEMIAALDAPVYVERVALFDAKQRTRAARAIEKALRLQVEGKGFSFVEVLAECPTHLRITPQEAEVWVKEQMLPVFPLGVKKDVVAEPWEFGTPTFDPAQVLATVGAKAAGAKGEAARRTGPARAVGAKFAGAGGDGAQTAAMLLAKAGIAEGLDATHIPSYGPESRGGTSYADVRLADGQVLSPDVPEPDILLAFNAPSLAKFAPTVAPGGTIVYDASVITSPPPLGAAKVVAVPAAAIAAELGQPLVKNVVALGALQAATDVLPAETILKTIREALQGKRVALADLNEEAFRRGQKVVTG